MEYFDEYISLGGNCEIGFQFRRYGKEPSSLFSWLVSDIDKIIEVSSNNFQNFYNFEDLIPFTHNMVKSKKHGLCFHSKLISKKSAKTKKLEFVDNLKTRKQYYNDEVNKYNYLIKKWNNLVSSKANVAYFIKNQSYKYEKILELEAHFKRKYPKHKFRIIFIKEGSEFNHHVISNNLSICYVRSFSDIHYSWASDLNSWDKIFDLYPLVNKIKLSGLGGNENFLVKSISSIKRNQEYSFPINFNIAQFFEQKGFLEDAQYFIEKARKQSPQEFIEKEYLRIIQEKNKKENKKNGEISKRIKNFHTLLNENKIQNAIVEYRLLVWKYEQIPLRIDVYKEIRYVRFSLQEKSCFHLDKIEVWDINDKNIALDKSLMMSSTYKMDSPVTNKKSLNSIISGKASFHTKNEHNPWVVLDLENYEKVKSIIIFNREGKYAERALSILVETSNDLKEWDTVYDNYELFKKINNNKLNVKQKGILEKIKSFTEPPSMISIQEAFLNLLGLEKKKTKSFESKVIKYTLLIMVKSYHQIKVDIKKSVDQAKELAIVNQAVILYKGELFEFTLEDNIKRKEVLYDSCKNDTIPVSIQIQIKLFLKNINMINHDSDEFSIIKYAILGKYGAISRLNKDLSESSNKEKTNKLINMGLEICYGKGYVLTKQGINKCISNSYAL